MEDYAGEAMDLHTLVVERMRLLDTDAYENLLRPAFKDEPSGRRYGSASLKIFLTTLPNCFVSGPEL